MLSTKLYCKSNKFSSILAAIPVSGILAGTLDVKITVPSSKISTRFLNQPWCLQVEPTQTHRKAPVCSIMIPHHFHILHQVLLFFHKHNPPSKEVCTQFKTIFNSFSNQILQTIIGVIFLLTDLETLQILLKTIKNIISIAENYYQWKGYLGNQLTWFAPYVLSRNKLEQENFLTISIGCINICSSMPKQLCHQT